MVDWAVLHHLSIKKMINSNATGQCGGENCSLKFKTLCVILSKRAQAKTRQQDTYIQTVNKIKSSKLLQARREVSCWRRKSHQTKPDARSVLSLSFFVYVGINKLFLTGVFHHWDIREH